MNKGETKPAAFLSARPSTMVDDMIAGELEGGFDESSSGSGTAEDGDEDEEESEE